MELNERQKKRIAIIIDRHIGWMIGWSVDEQTREEGLRSAANDIAKYLKRSFRSMESRPNETD